MPQPEWISHRGLCEAATENTAESFRAALEAGFTHLETDLRTSADGHLVLAHDDDLSRVAGEPVRVSASDRPTLEAVRLRGGERLLFFDQWLARFGDQRWILDIKPEQGERTVRALLAQADGPARELLTRRARFLFWDRAQQRLLRRHLPGSECLAPLPECRRAGLACVAGLSPLGGIEPGATYALPPRLGRVALLKPAVVRRYRRRGGRVLAYLPETEGEVETALAAGVDEVLTNGRPLG